MRDLDFDEIDRAVGSVIGEHTETSNSTEPEPMQEQPKPAIITPKTRVIPHRKGRFLDMVSANTSMKNQAELKPQQLRPKVSREAPEVKPDNVKATEQAAELSEPESKDNSSFGPEVESLNKMQDKADEANLDVSEELEPASVPSDRLDEPEGADVEDIGTSGGDEKTEELAGGDEGLVSDTPFLPDAKVEKRPLGGVEPEKIASTPDIHKKIEGLDTVKPAPAEPATPAIIKSKGSSGWLWAILVLLLAALGAGIGLATYIFLLQ